MKTASPIAAVTRAWADQPLTIKGLVVVALPLAILISALTHFGQATAINIVYSSRGLFGVLLVIFLGAQLGNLEASQAGSKIMRNRLFGSLLLCAAIILVFVR